MKTFLKIFYGLMMLAVIQVSDAQAAAVTSPDEPQFYKYAHNDAEYSVLLPEPPIVETIWADAGPIPYIANAPKDSALGEIATFHRVDPKTEDVFDVKITFLKTDSAFVKGLTQENMIAALEKDIGDLSLDDKKYNFSAGTNTLKWATITGFSVDKNNRPFYNALHYLTGLQSILVVKVQYSVENKLFEDFYKKLTDNITYHAL